MKVFPKDIYDMKKTETVGGLKITTPSKTNTAGAMTKKQQVRRLMAQGAINKAWANGMFPSTDDVPDDFIPPDYAPDAMSILDEQRAVLRGHNEGKAKQIAAEKQANRLAADEKVAARVEADKDTRDDIERAPE